MTAPSAATGTPDRGAQPLLAVRDLAKHYGGEARFLRAPQALVRAVDGVDLDIYPGETLGLVGESGSGKSTVGRLVLRLEAATRGQVVFEGRNLSALTRSELRPVRQRMQIVFQDPYSALNPRMRVGDFVAEPFIVHGLLPRADERQSRVEKLFQQVGLDPASMRRFPHEFSGGQRQRINIARALALQPRFIVADEPITALDVTIQAQIVNLLQDLQEQLGLTYLFIAHDLSMVRYLCQHVAVMLRGRIVETGPAESVFGAPRHPYTQALLSALPIPDPVRERLRQRIVFDPRDFQPAPDAALREVAPRHFVLD